MKWITTRLLSRGAGAGSDAVRFAERANLPLFAEPSSGARYGSSAITDYVQALGSDLADQVRRVVIFGKPTLSRPIIALIKRCNVYCRQFETVWQVRRW